METNEIMTNEEVVETTEEIVKTSSGKSLKIAAGFGLAVFAGVIAYKYIAQPMIAKIKAKKNETQIDGNFDTVECDETKEVEVETE